MRQAVHQRPGVSTLVLPVASYVAAGKSLCVSEPLVSLWKMGR